MTVASGTGVGDALPSDLKHRAGAARERAREVLGDAAPPPGSPLHASIDALVERLSDAGDGDVRPAQDLHEQRLAMIRERPEQLLEALDAVRVAVERLSRLTTPSAMLAAAPEELSGVSELRRVVLSSVRDGLMTVEGAAFRDHDALAAVLPALRSEPLRLVHRLVETEVVRRRRAVLVDGSSDQAGVDPRMADIMEWGGFVVAPITVGTRVIALVHADRGPDRPVDVVDRDVVWAFTTELARTYESASLRRGLRQEREQMTQLLDWLDARSRQLAAADITLDPTRAATRRPQSAAVPGAGAARHGGGDIAIFDGLLTRRELEVLRHLSEGLTNRAIAEELVVSTGTVKSHVNRILTKLHVANRAEAVARYYALVIAPPRG